MTVEPDKLLGTLRAIVSDKLGIDESKIVEGADFIGDLGADSLLVIEIVMEIEDKCNVTIPESAARQMRTVGDALSYVRSQMATS
jgi:acyl carrier protein